MTTIKLLSLIKNIFKTQIYGVQVEDWAVIKDRRNITLNIDNSFSSKEKEIIVQSIQEWREKIPNLNLNYFFREIPEDEMVSFLTDGIPTIYNGIDWSIKRFTGLLYALIPFTAGISFYNFGDIFILRDYSFEATVKHKIGHIISDTFGHSKDKNSLMYWLRTKDNSQITNADIEFLTRGE